MTGRKEEGGAEAPPQDAVSLPYSSAHATAASA